MVIALNTHTHTAHIHTHTHTHTHTRAYAMHTLTHLIMLYILDIIH